MDVFRKKNKFQWNFITVLSSRYFILFENDKYSHSRRFT